MAGQSADYSIGQTHSSAISHLPLRLHAHTLHTRPDTTNMATANPRDRNRARGRDDSTHSSLTFSLQALLHRHESYMAEAESDRAAFTATIESLTREKSEMQSANAAMAHENRALVAQLEGVNAAAAESETRVQTLTMQLEEAEGELRRLGVAAARLADLEAQVADMEADQERVMAGVVESEEERRSAVQRWREAESTLRELHDQVDRIECEARKERERHEEVVARLERRRAVERELDGAAGRLKGAAAASELGKTQSGGNVVSRFVRDILADNANLQVGIMELRDLLESSNQEVQSLRDQVLMHQPVQDKQLPTLSEELETKDRSTREYHIHHHYHTPTHSRGRGGSARRKKRRPQSGTVTPRSLSASQLPARHQHQSSASSTSTILSQTSVSIPPSHRWSAQTADASIASSPQSVYRPSSIFDRPEYDEPTSPNSTIFSSPLGVRQRKNSLDQFQSLGGLDELNPNPDPAYPTEASEDQTEQSDDIFVPRLRRPASHDSLLSVAGMDVHTPGRSRAVSRSGLGLPSQPIHIPRRIASPNMTVDSTGPVTATTAVTATAAGRESPKPGERSPRSSLLASVGGETKGSATETPAGSTPSLTSSLGRRMGGWVKGKWGMAAIASAADADPASTNEPQPHPDPEAHSQPRKQRTRDPIPIFRQTGVNQSGPVKGFGPPPRSNRGVRVDRLDEGLLRESLAE